MGVAGSGNTRMKLTSSLERGDFPIKGVWLLCWCLVSHSTKYLSCRGGLTAMGLRWCNHAMLDKRAEAANS
jgi:hypothetical protein